MKSYTGFCKHLMANGWKRVNDRCIEHIGWAELTSDWTDGKTIITEDEMKEFYEEWNPAEITLMELFPQLATV